jgi:hypothetical protein
MSGMVFDCPGLEPPFVELTEEREQHIRYRHPELLPIYIEQLRETISNPDFLIADGPNPHKQTFVRWFPDLRGGKFLIAQVVTDYSSEPTRHWIVTAYLDSVRPS